MTATMRFTSVRLMTLVMLVVAVDLGSALRCWSCSSTSDKDCHDPFNHTHMSITDCDQNRSQSSYSSYTTAVCKKLKQRGTGGSSDNLITIRQCDWVTEHRGQENRDTRVDACATSSSPYLKVESCETCTTDGCNGSNSHIIASTWCALIPLIAYIGIKKTL